MRVCERERHAGGHTLRRVNVVLGIQRLGNGFEEDWLLGEAVDESPIGRDAYLWVGRTVETELLEFGHAL